MFTRNSMFAGYIRVSSFENPSHWMSFTMTTQCSWFAAKKNQQTWSKYRVAGPGKARTSNKNMKQICKDWFWNFENILTVFRILCEESSLPTHPGVKKYKKLCLMASLIEISTIAKIWFQKRIQQHWNKIWINSLFTPSCFEDKPEKKWMNEWMYVCM